MNNILTQNLSKYFLPGSHQNVHLNNRINNNDVKYINITRNATNLINNFFMPINVLASKPIYSNSRNKITINVFYFVPSNGNLNNNTINNLGDALSYIFMKSVELRLVKLNYPYIDRYILAQYIAMYRQKYTLRMIVKNVFKRVKPVEKYDINIDTILPSYIIGMKIRLSGRLITEMVKPRKTVQTMEMGTFSKNNMSIVDYRSYTTKNDNGSFTIKVWISQRAV